MDTASLAVTAKPKPDEAVPATPQAPDMFAPARSIWALFRLLEAGDCRPCTAKERSYTFGEGTRAVTLKVKVEGSETFGDPFDKSRLWKFKCPSNL